MNKIDNQFAPNRTSSPSNAHSSGASSSAPPPPAPPRSRAGSGTGALPPVSRSVTANGGRSQGAPVFTNLDPSEKSAFFALLDEYFATRPQYKAAFEQAAGQQAVSSSLGPAPTQPHVAQAQAPPRPPPRQQLRGLGTATAAYDFEGQTAEDLAFKEGDRITVLEHNWWRGELNGQTGMFPSSYVQMDS
ncbi:hypothetical protein OIV83_006023 [Microbotryomycetes sp. JL201]|nr:hypothetical protein OIV83_006023 [Microbotryomycetes sp. JL201]